MNVKIGFKSILLAAALAAMLLAPAETWAQKGNKPGGGGGGSTSYSIIKLDDVDDVGGTQEGFAYDINNSRLVVGSARNVLGDTAACWTVAKVGKSYTSELHFLTGGDYAVGCNTAGEIVGGGNQAAVYWEDRNSVAQQLLSPLGSAHCGAEAISNDGVICGWSETPAQGRTAIAWRVVQGVASEPLVLETVEPDENGEDYVVANDVSGQDLAGVISIVGESNGNAVTWTVTLAPNGGLVAGPTTVLSSLGNAKGANNLGQVCGRADGDHLLWDGVVWTDGIAQVLSGYPIDPRDINDSGVVVGYSGPFPGQAVVWSSPSAAKVSLNNFLRNSPFSSLALATAVNPSGDIVGYGWSQGFNRAFLAIPK